MGVSKVESVKNQELATPRPHRLVLQLGFSL